MKVFSKFLCLGLVFGVMSATVVALPGSDFPDKHRPYVDLFYPQNKIVVDKDIILIKGVNRYQGAVFVNGHQIRVKDDGRFSYRHHLNTLGKHVVIVSFITPDHQIIHVTRQIIRRLPTLNNSKRDSLSGKEMFFYNTKYSPLKQSKKLVKGLVTRAQLATFLNAVRGESNDDVQSKVLSDVPISHWASSDINQVVFKKIMGLFPNLKFKPEQTVTRLSYIIGLSRALSLDLTKNSQVAPYKDINPHHWTYDYIRTLHHHKYLPKTSRLRAHSKLSQTSFVKWVRLIDPVRKSMDDAMNFDFGFYDAEFVAIKLQIQTFLLAQKKRDYKLRVLTLNSPKQHQIELGDDVVFNGKIFPPKQFKVNGSPVVPNMNSEFSFSRKIRKGRNDFWIETFKNEKQQRTVWSLDGFSDMNGHWFHKQAAQLKYIRIIEGKTFNPAQVVDRAQFSSIISRLFRFGPLNNDSLPFSDLSRENKSYRAIKALYDRGVLSGESISGKSSLKIYPARPLTKIELLVMMVRIADYQPLNQDQLSSIVLPFKDIKSYSWAIDTLKTAMYYNLLSSDIKLNPASTVTTDIMMAMLYRLPQIQTKLKSRFR